MLETEQEEAKPATCPAACPISETEPVVHTSQAIKL
jgi:hypothetical protein